jgi:hypothetical protein
MLNTIRTLVTNGDSWTYGSEIMAPEFLAGPGKKGYGMGNRYKKGRFDTDQENDYYRIPRIWPTILAEKIGCENVNLGWPARSNDGIYESTISWLLKNYVIPGRPTNDLLVMIGWSSPERKNVIIDENGYTYMQTIWPAMRETSYYVSSAAKSYFKMHVRHLWTEAEYISRFIEQNHNLKLFCDHHKINYHCFNAFYETPSANPSMWKSVNIKDTIESWDISKFGGWTDPLNNWENKIDILKLQWDMIKERFILKDQGSFKSYIDQYVDKNDRMINWHPSPISHGAWAEYLHQHLSNQKNSIKKRRFKDLLPLERKQHV